MIIAMGKKYIKSCFYLLKIILYTVLFSQVNQIYILKVHPKYIRIMSFFL